MTKTYSWDEREVTQPSVEQRTIVMRETVTEEREVRFTLAQKMDELQRAKQAVIDAQKRVKDLENEVKEIKQALGIEAEKSFGIEAEKS